MTAVGVGPYPEPWPEDPRLDPVLLAEGDRRNVADRYRYWRVEAIRDDLAARARPVHVAVENLQHDFNIGSVVRTANAFGVRAVHVIGRRRWNRRGAMMTEAYLDVRHHPDMDEFSRWAQRQDVPIVGVDNLPGAVDLRDVWMPSTCVLLLGQEGPGLSDAARRASCSIAAIPQVGSTRSINAGAAAAIAMWEWVHRWDRA